MIRTKVLSQEVQGDKLVIGLRILKTYKGGSSLNQTEGIRVYGSNNGSLFAKAYTPNNGGICGVDYLENGTVYLIGGTILNGRIDLQLCRDTFEAWSRVTRRQRAGIRRFYGQNCGCETPSCYGETCGKLTGCLKSSMSYGYDECQWKHTYCLKNANGTACSWRETAEFKNCRYGGMP